MDEDQQYYQQTQEELLQPQPWQPDHSTEMADTGIDQTVMPSQPVQPPQPHVGGVAGWFKKWSSLFVLSLALAIIVIDSTLLNVSLEAIIKDLHTNIQNLQWVISAYSLTLAALTIVGGRLGDFFGRKRMFMFGAIVFAIGSFIASISPNVGTLIAGESIIEGIGAAFMMPATASLLVANFHGKDRAKAFGVWGGIAGASSAIGPILGGWLTNNYSWRWGFRINVGVVILLLIGSFLIKESQDQVEKPQLDFVGILLSAAGLLAIVYGVIESSTYGWIKASQDFMIGNQGFTVFGLSIVPFIILIGILFLDLFVEWELKRDRDGNTPLVSMKIFENWTFSAGSLTTAIISLGQFGLFFVLPVYLQGVHGLDAFHTGLVNLPVSITILVMAPLSGMIATRILPKYLIQIGLVVNLAAIVVLGYAFSPTGSVADLIPGLILYGIGIGLVMAQVSNITLSAVSVQQAGEASGVMNTLRQVGSTFGSSIIGAVLLLGIAANVTKTMQQTPSIPAPIRDHVIASVNDPNSNLAFGGGGAVGGNVPAAMAQQLDAISKKATTDAAQTTMIYAFIFVLLGLAASFALPSEMPHKRQNLAGGH